MNILNNINILEPSIKECKRSKKFGHNSNPYMFLQYNILIYFNTRNTYSTRMQCAYSNRMH